MVSVRKHYENHLAHYYAWICGGAEINIAENRNFFKTHNIQPIDNGHAFDLGAGCGFQSIPLAELGFHVIAMDLSARLLGELMKNAAHLPIETICDDMSNFSTYARTDLELVVCMGDTLTHLENLKKVAALLQQAYTALMPGGCVILSFRNLSQALSGLDRFIAVCSNDKTIFTCFLEYEKETVRVHDIIYEKKKDQWVMHKSAYPKCRISPEWTRDYMQQIGFTIEFYAEKKELIFMIARKK
jgi:2-polyprenyl-3-methyl-5-hydroxy-6-metoxy-1,4-benzoquinol methylase